MKIETQNYDNAAVVELQGEFTSEAAKAFQDAISSVVATGVAGVVIDATKVTFIDSAALEQFMWLRDYCNENARQLKLSGLDDNCKKIFEMTRLDGLFDCYDELAESVKTVV